MDIDQLKLFVAIIHQDSLSGAAEQVSITQSAASQSIARLEAEMGVKLFTRSKKGLTLNQEGKLFYSHAVNILNEVEAAQQEISDTKGKVTGMLNLQVLAASALIPRLLYDFLQAYPEINFHMVQRKNVEEYDICINATANAASNELPASACQLLEEEVMLAVPAREHSFAEKDCISLNEAKNENFIMMRHGSVLRTLANSACYQAGFSPHIVFEADNPSMVREMIRMGLGVAFLPRISWNIDQDQQDIHLLHIENPECRRTIYLQTPNSRGLSRSVATFRSFAVEYFQKLGQGEGI